MINKKTPYLFLLLLAAGAMLWSCHKESSLESGSGGTLPPGPQGPQTTIQGRVLDESKRPLSGATVICGTAAASTDINGNFRFDKVVVPNPANAVIKVIKSGYFTGIRTLVATTNAEAYAQIELLRKKSDASFDSRSGGTVSLNNTELTFVAGQVRNAAGQLYTGKVSVAFAHINPEAANFRDIMPGDLRGTNLAGTEVGLQSYGMMAVELLGDNGETLQLDPTKKVTMKMTIPASLLANAPVTIPLWYFDETSGLWKEEGSATKQGNQYVGTVSHFSFWNCDAPFPLVDFKVQLVDAQGVVLPNLQVQITKKTDGATAYCYSNNKGEIWGKVPANTPLEMTISSDCVGLLALKDLAALTSNTDLGILKVDIPLANVLRITGTAEDCNNKPVANGAVNILIEGKNYRTDINNGTFSLVIVRCTTTPVTAQVFVLDAATNATATDRPEYSVGNISPSFKVCGPIAEKVLDIKFENTSFKIAHPLDTISVSAGNEGLYISAAVGRQGNIRPFLYLRTNSYRLGTHDVESFTYGTYSGYYTNRNKSVKITITKLPNTPGDLLEGSFSGTVVSDSSANAVTFPITGTFRFRK